MKIEVILENRGDKSSAKDITIKVWKITTPQINEINEFINNLDKPKELHELTLDIPSGSSIKKVSYEGDVLNGIIYLEFYFGIDSNKKINRKVENFKKSTVEHLNAQLIKEFKDLSVSTLSWLKFSRKFKELGTADRRLDDSNLEQIAQKYEFRDLSVKKINKYLKNNIKGIYLADDADTATYDDEEANTYFNIKNKHYNWLHKVRIRTKNDKDSTIENFVDYSLKTLAFTIPVDGSKDDLELILDAMKQDQKDRSVGSKVSAFGKFPNTASDVEKSWIIGSDDTVAANKPIIKKIFQKIHEELKTTHWFEKEAIGKKLKFLEEASEKKLKFETEAIEKILILHFITLHHAFKFPFDQRKEQTTDIIDTKTLLNAYGVDSWGMFFGEFVQKEDGNWFLRTSIGTKYQPWLETGKGGYWRSKLPKWEWQTNNFRSVQNLYFKLDFKK